MKWKEQIRRWFSTRYTRSLEAEIDRLRAENRALVNSILSIAGLPPLRLEAEIAREHRREEMAARAQRPLAATSVPKSSPPPRMNEPGAENAAKAAIGARPGIVLPANPHRRRSWQQINRILELEEARQMIHRDNSEAMQPAPRD